MGAGFELLWGAGGTPKPEGYEDALSILCFLERLEKAE